ncbi:hypothetical protein HanRHA438_Chr03g0134891 [Helianthus annuus]|nr:hypothetical protein HanRHA438_Chr03g0134891 [Helianthus annuus]
MVTHQISQWGGSECRTVAWKDRCPHRPPSHCHPGSGLQVQVGYDPLVPLNRHQGCTGPDRRVLGSCKVTGVEECRIRGSCGAHFQNEAQKSVVGKVRYSVIPSAWLVQRTISKDLGQQCFEVLMGSPMRRPCFMFSDVNRDLNLFNQVLLYWPGLLIRHSG